MNKIHARRYPLNKALCGNDEYVELPKFFMYDKSIRCECCTEALRRKGYDLKGLEIRFKNEANKYTQLSQSFIDKMKKVCII